MVPTEDETHHIALLVGVALRPRTAGEEFSEFVLGTLRHFHRGQRHGKPSSPPRADRARTLTQDQATRGGFAPFIIDGMPALPTKARRRADRGTLLFLEPFQ